MTGNMSEITEKRENKKPPAACAGGGLFTASLLSSFRHYNPRVSWNG
jgi:hypothetical protein